MSGTRTENTAEAAQHETPSSEQPPPPASVAPADDIVGVLWVVARGRCHGCFVLTPVPGSVPVPEEARFVAKDLAVLAALVLDAPEGLLQAGDLEDAARRLRVDTEGEAGEVGGAVDQDAALPGGVGARLDL